MVRGGWGGHHHGGGGRGCRDDGMYNMTDYITTLEDCSADFACATRRGEGRFVCRESYHPVTGMPVEAVVRCVPVDKAWTTDVCGCCGGTCPDPFEHGACHGDDSSSDEEGEDDETPTTDLGDTTVAVSRLASSGPTIKLTLGGLFSVGLAALVV